MASRLVTMPELSRAIAEAMLDAFSRKIMTSTMLQGKTIETISAENDIPLSTAYRRVHDLEAKGIVVVERIVLTSSGKRYAVYRSAFTEVKMDLEADGFSVQVTPNSDVADKLYRVWQSIALR